MRLLKEYNQFITEAKKYDDKFGIPPELESDVADIFVELRDLGFEVDVQRWISQSDMICVTLSPIDSESSRDRIKISEVKEYVMMLIDYMKMKYDVKSVTYDICLGDFDTGETKNYSYKRFPDVLKDLDTDEFGINFEVDDYEISEGFINEGFGDFSEADYDKIESDINDMFIELKDNGAQIKLEFYHKGVGYGVGPEDYMMKIWLYSDRGFKLSEVEGPAMMTKDYIQDLTDREVHMEYQLSSDYTNTRQTKFNPYSFDTSMTIYLIEKDKI